MKLSILVCHVPERMNLMSKLRAEFNRQMVEGVELLIDARPRGEVSVGLKRQTLLEHAQGEWIVFFDDDDWPSKDYIKLILSHLGEEYDCIGINGVMFTNGKKLQTWCHRLGYDWEENIDGFDYVRPIIHFNPVRREVALKAGFKDIRFGEDKDYSERLNQMLYKENFIKEPLFTYRFSTDEPFEKKYGIKKLIKRFRR